jgi:hypothetical protein
MSTRKIPTSLQSITSAITFRNKKLKVPQKNLFEILKYSKTNPIGTIVRKKKDLGFIQYKITDVKLAPVN